MFDGSLLGTDEGITLGLDDGSTDGKALGCDEAANEDIRLGLALGTVEG